jgi:hypothetical protein
VLKSRLKTGTGGHVLPVRCSFSGAIVATLAREKTLSTSVETKPSLTLVACYVNKRHGGIQGVLGAQKGRKRSRLRAWLTKHRSGFSVKLAHTLSRRHGVFTMRPIHRDHFEICNFFLWLTSPEGDEIQLLLMVSRRREELQNHASEDIDIYADCSKPSTRMWHMVAALALFVLKSTQMRR